MKLLLTAAFVIGIVAVAPAADVKQTLDRTLEVYQQQLKTILSSSQTAQLEAEQALAKAKADLPEQYRQLLATQERAHQIQGNLNGVLETRREKIRFEETKELPPNACTVLPILFEPQTNAFRALRAVERAKSKRVVDLADKYLVSLNQFKKNLTLAGKIDDAVMVDAEITKVNDRPEITAARFVLAEAATNCEAPDRLPDALSLRTKTGIRSAVAQWNPGPAGIASEDAVLRALRWLKKNQKEDGTWAGTAPPAMTAMALLAYLAHGETPQSTEFGPTVKRSLDWFLANQNANGHFKGKDGTNYTQPITAYALCEAYGLTQNQALKDAAIKAINTVVKGQNAVGGFNYNLDASARNDSSYMAWCCQALKAAKISDLEADVPGLESAIKKGIAGFKLNADASGGFGYCGPGHTGLSGAGAYCMQVLGAPHAMEVVKTMRFLETCTFSFTTPDQQPYGGGSHVYYWYYITQAKFHHRPETFAAWNKMFSPELCKQQMIEKNAIEGPDGNMVDIGHWESPSKSEHRGGIVQDTSLCALQLMVYYRYKPSYLTQSSGY